MKPATADKTHEIRRVNPREVFALKPATDDKSHDTTANPLAESALSQLEPGKKHIRERTNPLAVSAVKSARADKTQQK